MERNSTTIAKGRQRGILILLVVGFLRGFVQMGPILEPFKIGDKTTMPCTPGVGATSASASSKQCLDIQIDKNVSVRFTPNLELEPDKCLIYEKPLPYIELLMRTVVGFPNHGMCTPKSCNDTLPYDAIKRKYGDDWPPYAFTMVGQQRLENF
jgi:Macrocin-O-methyltransferase (TylF)